MRWLNTVPDWIKGTIALVIAVVGFIAFARDNLYPTITVTAGLVLLSILLGSLYVAFSRKRSEFGKNGLTWRYPEYRTIALIIIALDLIFSIALVVFKPSRYFIIASFVGTPTPTPTLTSTPTPTSTSTLTPMPVLGIGSIEISPIDGTILLYVPAGEFTMGNKAEDGLAECQKNRSDCQRDWFTDEEPAHTVYLDAFYMDKYEVSNAAYRECVNRGLCQPPTKVSSSTRSSYYSDSQFDDYPVIYVDWNMAKNYCEWRGARLPTEAEWEKAARGTDGRMYPWGNVFDGSKTNFCDENCSIDWANKNYNDGYADTAPVNAYPDGMSVYGIFNLAGNVWEWVADWYDATYYARSPSSNPQGPFSGDGRALRGGSWYVTGDSVRASNRRGNDVPSTSVDFFGFRCARSLP